jgi:hypothetical protein
MKDSIVDFSANFQSTVTGAFSYLYSNFKLAISLLIELVLMSSVIALHENLMKLVVLDIVKRTRNRQIILSLTLVSKLLALATVNFIEKTLSVKDCTFMCLMCLFSYKFATLM